MIGKIKLINQFEYSYYNLLEQKKNGEKMGNFIDEFIPSKDTRAYLHSMLIQYMLSV